MSGRHALPIALFAAWLYLARVPEAPTLPTLRADVPQEPIGVTTAPDTIEELQKRIGAILDREHVAGAAIALVGRDGPIWVGGVGVRDRATQAPMSADTVFRVGSLSKSVIALGVMRLVDQGKLDIDRPLREVIPDLEFQNAWEAEAPVTLAQVMEHTSGFDDVRFSEIFGDERISVRDTLALNPRSRITRWRPGTRHGYSNVGFTVAARAIEVATGEPFDVYIRREILAPLGIADADFQRTAILESRLASGYMGSDDPVAFHPFAHRPSAALLASARDLGKIVQFFIARGEGFPPIVSPAGLARIERAGTLPYPRTDAEYGFANYGDIWHPIRARGHDGGMPGFHASFRYFPSLDVGYAFLLNSNYTFRGYVELRSLLFSYLAKGRTSSPPTAPVAERPGASYFALRNTRHALFDYMDRHLDGWRVTDAGDHLDVAGLDGYHFELVPTPDNNYRRPNESGSSISFTTAADGTPLMLMGVVYAEATDEQTARLKYAALQLVMALLKLAPLYAIAMLVFGLLERRRIVPTSVLLWPAVASLLCAAIPHLMIHGFMTGVVGDVHPLTVALFAVTIGFAVASVATLVSAVRVLLEPERPPLIALLMPLVCGIAFTGYAMFMASGGMIGLRTWAW